MATRVYGQLFDDGRDGILAIQPSAPFFGCVRHERHFPVTDGCIDISLMPTPAGIHYNVGFKEPGDTRRTDFTLKWRLKNVPEVNISSRSDEEPSQRQQGDRPELVQVKRLASDLSNAMKQITELKAQLNLAYQQLAEISSKFESYKAATELSLVERDLTISALQVDKKPEVHTVIKEVPVPPEDLHMRIKYLESELLKAQELNSTYYQSVLELYQLKLDKAQTISSAPTPTVDDTPRQRLLHKLLSK